jgi:hypothetical protein
MSLNADNMVGKNAQPFGKALKPVKGVIFRRHVNIEKHEGLDSVPMKSFARTISNPFRRSAYH